MYRSAIFQNTQNVKISHLKGTFFSVPIKDHGLMSWAQRYSLKNNLFIDIDWKA